MERLQHMCVADGSAFRNKNIPDAVRLNDPELYLFARNFRLGRETADFGSITRTIANQRGYSSPLPPDVRIAIQGGIVCAVSGCEVELAISPVQPQIFEAAS